MITPQLQDILQDREHYGVTAQSELSTDILFKSRQGLAELYPELLSHGTLCFGAKVPLPVPLSRSRPAGELSLPGRVGGR